MSATASTASTASTAAAAAPAGAGLRVLPLLRLQGHTAQLWCVRPWGDLLATAGADWTVRLWSRDGGEPLAVLKRHRGIVYDLAPVCGGELLASAGDDSRCVVWNRAGEALAEFVHGDQPLSCVKPHPTRTAVVYVSSEDGTVSAWDVAVNPPNRIATLTGHRGPIWDMVFIGDRLYTASRDGTVRIWDGETEVGQLAVPHETAIATSPYRGHEVYCLCPVGDSHLMSGGSATFLWDLRTHTARPLPKTHITQLPAVMVVYGEQLLIASLDGRIAGIALSELLAADAGDDAAGAALAVRWAVALRETTAFSQALAPTRATWLTAWNGRLVTAQGRTATAWGLPTLLDLCVFRLLALSDGAVDEETLRARLPAELIERLLARRADYAEMLGSSDAADVTAAERPPETATRGKRNCALQ